MITKYISDIDMAQICDSGQCFRMYRVEEGCARITGMPEEFEVIAGDRYLRVGQSSVEQGETLNKESQPASHNKGNQSAGQVEKNKLIFSCTEEEYEDFWKTYFDIESGTDYAGIKRQVFENAKTENDLYLLEAVKTGWGIRILNQDLWEMIVTFLISQQNNIPRIHKCIDNICRKYGRPMELPEANQKLDASQTEKATSQTEKATSQTEKATSQNEKATSQTEVSGSKFIYYTFPTPEALAVLEEDALMECNLGYRSKYVVRTAKEIVSGKFNLDDIQNMNYLEARVELLKMFGVGVKVADCICLFALHHLEAFPVDTHINQVLEREYDCQVRMLAGAGPKRTVARTKIGNTKTGNTKTGNTKKGNTKTDNSKIPNLPKRTLKQSIGGREDGKQNKMIELPPELQCYEGVEGVIQQYIFYAELQMGKS